MSRANTIALIGGHLALDFANTAGWHASDERSEWLSDYAELLAWAGHVGALAAGDAATLLRQHQRHPQRGARALAAAIGLRESVYRTFTALAQRRIPSPQDLAALHTARVAALNASEPTWRAGALAFRWRTEPADLGRPVYPVMLAVAELLSSPDLGRLRQCGRHPCGWLFLDRSRNGTRRWCSSTECGNATRVRRFRERLAGGSA